MKALKRGLLPLSLAIPTLLCAQEKKNILFILLDDLQATAVGFNDNDQVVSPNMDQIFRSGVTFSNTYTNGALSGALSMPSRAMIMTGRGVYEVRKDGEYIPEEHTTLPELLRNQGYNTFGTGKWHNGISSFHRSFNYGGCMLFGGMHQYSQNGHVTPYLQHFDPTGEYKEERFIGDKFSSEMFADTAVEFIESQKKAKKPFFAYVAFTSPHDPRDQHPDYGHKYNAEEIELPINFAHQHAFDNGDLYIRDEVLLPPYRTEEAVKADIANYYGMVSEVDVQIGRIIKALKDSGKYDDTIIVLTSDNGLAVGRHGLLGKQNLYEHSISVPMVIVNPNGLSGQNSDAYCYLYDIYPTLCELIGIEQPASITGQSFAKSLSNPDLKHRKQLFLAYNNLQRGLVRDGWKYIVYNANGIEIEQLFNLNDDPWEMVNLAEDSKYDFMKSAYRRELIKEMKENNDFCDLNKPIWGTTPHQMPWKEAVKLYE